MRASLCRDDTSLARKGRQIAISSAVSCAALRFVAAIIATSATMLCTCSPPEALKAWLLGARVLSGPCPQPPTLPPSLPPPSLSRCSLSRARARTRRSLSLASLPFSLCTHLLARTFEASSLRLSFLALLFRLLWLSYLRTAEYANCVGSHVTRHRCEYSKIQEGTLNVNLEETLTEAHAHAISLSLACSLARTHAHRGWQVGSQARNMSWTELIVSPVLSPVLDHW